MILDVRTVVILSAATPLGLGFLMAVYWKERKVYAGFGRWVLANFGFSVGFFLLALRGQIPDFFSIIAGNCITVYSEILIYEGVQRFFDRSSFSLPNYLILAFYLLVQSYFTYFDPNVNARVVLISIVFIVLILRSGAGLVRPAITGLTRTARSAASVFFITALFPFVRAIYTLLQPGPVDLLFDNINSWFSVILIISITAWTFYFFFLTSARLELELDQAREEMTQFAITDSHTELYNRRYFLERSEIELKRAKRYNESISLLFVDVDHFKSINDRYGHHTGDLVLAHVAKILRGEIRSYDLAARFGGDEFVLMLYSVNKEQAILIAERIRSAVERNPLTIHSQTLQIRLSLGVAHFEPRDLDLMLALQRADTALYKAKNGGRNRVAVA